MQILDSIVTYRQSLVAELPLMWLIVVQLILQEHSAISMLGMSVRSIALHSAVSSNVQQERDIVETSIAAGLLAGCIRNDIRRTADCLKHCLRTSR